MTRATLVWIAASALAAQVPLAVLAQESPEPADEAAPTPPPPRPIEVVPKPRETSDVIETRREPRGPVPPRTVRPAPTLPVRGPRKVSAINVKELGERILEAYPVQAKREGREGNVGVTVDVSPDGRVDACRVTQSSGHTDLDEAACAGMERFARFDPAQGSDGRPTAASFSIRIGYRAD